MELRTLKKFFVILAIGFFCQGLSAQASFEVPGIGIRINHSSAPVIVSGVARNSVAEINGIKSGMQIISLDNRGISFLYDEDIQKLLDLVKEFYLFTMKTGDLYVYKNTHIRSDITKKHMKDIIQMPQEVTNASGYTYKFSAPAFDKYAKFYSIDPETLKIQYLGFDKSEIKNLPKEEKLVYKKVAKIQKYINKKQYLMALDLEKDYLPVYLYMFNDAIQDKENMQFGNALYALKKLEQFNADAPILNVDIINYNLGAVYLTLGEWELAMDYLRPFAQYTNQTSNNVLSSLMAKDHFQQGNYSTAVFYLLQIPETSPYHVWALKQLLECHRKLNNTAKVKEYLLILSKEAPCYDYYMELAKMTPSVTERMAYYKKAREEAISEDRNKMWKVNGIIKAYEQDKITRATQFIKGYYERPNWNKYENDYDKIYSYSDLFAYQDDFYGETNACIKKYQGTNLTKCFATVTKKYETILAKAEKRYYADLDYSRQKSLQDNMIREQEDMIRDLRREIESLKTRGY